MDDLLPSYESATEQNPWLYIAEYLPSELLCTTALVCRKWHTIMTPYLWGQPASHFGVQNDTVYVALTRFKRILPYARPSVRALTHTLQFPPAHAEIYGGPHAEWLRDCLEYLPRLQCLIVDGLPFFDHASLLSMRYMSPRVRMVSPNRFPIYGLRLLDASRCTNATSTGLAEALPHFPDLVSLDLSWTLAARDEAVLKRLQYLRNLRVLNLRGLGLKDSDFALIAKMISTRVRSLDVSSNHLTDASARLMLETCMKESSTEQQVNRSPRTRINILGMNNEPDIVDGDNLVVHLRNTLTRGFVGSLAIEDAPNVGITHLYITGNSITVEGISGLLHSRRLQVLDIGVVPTVWENPSLTGEAGEQLRLPGVSKLMPVLAENAARMHYLRVNYELVTEDAPAEAVSSPQVELPSDSTPQHQPKIPELEAVEQSRIELDAIGSALQELHGDTSHPSELPAEELLGSSAAEAYGRETDQKPAELKLQRAPTVTVTPEPRNIEYDSTIAPEIVSPSVTIDSATLSPGLAHDNQHYSVPSSPKDLEQSSGRLSPVSPLLGAMPETSNISKGRSRHNSSYFVEDRRARLDLRQSTERRLHPGMLPKVRTLVLTEVPTHTYEPQIIGRLIQYIKDAAEESSIARQRARYTYCLPPGRRRAVAEQEYTQNLFALQRIVFEMAPPRAPPKKVTSSWRAYPTKSSTEDADSEAFWEAATYDFSFFDDEECGLPRNEPGRTLPLTAMSGLELAPPDPMSARPVRTVAPERYIIDVVEEIAKFRKDRKTAYENALRRGEIEPEVEGYWPGDITVIRKPVDDAGELDCYGNRYESGWYYR